VERWRAFLDAPREVVQSESQAPPEVKGKKNLARDPLTALDKNRALAKKPGPRAARRQAYEDLFWALLNSGKFFFNH
jgi:hypothetical protein